jgi:hypothetical protein
MSRFRTVHVRTRPRHTPASVSHENGCFHYCLPRTPAFRSLSRFPNLCGPLCVDATPFSRWFQAFAAAAHLHAACEFGWWWTGTQVQALSASGRVGECWFHMSNIVLMLLALFFRWRWGAVLVVALKFRHVAFSCHYLDLVAVVPASEQHGLQVNARIEMCHQYGIESTCVYCDVQQQTMPCRSAGRSRIYESFFASKSLRLECGLG